MSPIVQLKLAATIREAEANRTALPGLPELADDDIAGAYAIQAINLDFWRAAGRRLVGWKLGCTSATVQAMLKAPGPDYGALFADRIRAGDAVIAAGETLQPMAEAEVAVTLARAVPRGATPAELVDAIAWVMPAIEVVDSRIGGWRMRFVDTIADNASAGFCVLGGPARRIEGLDLVDCAMTMRRNGEIVSSGAGRATMGGPLSALAWLSAQMDLAAGALVMTGSLGPVAKVAPGDRIEAEIAGLGAVRVDFAAP